jgi:hypothetical protein
MSQEGSNVMAGGMDIVMEKRRYRTKPRKRGGKKKMFEEGPPINSVDYTF